MVNNWNLKQDDFFPYAMKMHGYWTGYFTSRPTFKGYIREMSGLLQVYRLLQSRKTVINVL